MPIEYRINSSTKFIHTKAYGEVTGQGIIRHEMALSSDKDFSAQCVQLVDFTEVTNIDITTEELRGIAKHGPWNAHSKRAAVMPIDTLYGLARMYEVFNKIQNSSEFVIFRTIKEAQVWLEQQQEHMLHNLPKVSPEK